MTLNSSFSLSKTLNLSQQYLTCPYRTPTRGDRRPTDVLSSKGVKERSIWDRNWLRIIFSFFFSTPFLDPEALCCPRAFAPTTPISLCETCSLTPQVPVQASPPQRETSLNTWSEIAPTTPMVKNLPASAGDRGLFHGQGWFHMLKEDSTCRGATKPLHHNCWSLEASPLQQEKPTYRKEDPAQPLIKIK